MSRLGPPVSGFPEATKEEEKKEEGRGLKGVGGGEQRGWEGSWVVKEPWKGRHWEEKERRESVKEDVRGEGGRIKEREREGLRRRRWRRTEWEGS